MVEQLLNLILLLNSWYRFTLEHYIPPPKFCLFAETCNHTWIHICGYETNLKHNRMFLDECDMFEYNCDNQKVYYQTGIDDNCSEETVETSANPIQTLKMELTSMNDTSQSTVTTSTTTTTTEMTTTKPFTPQETASVVTTENIKNLTDSTTQEIMTSESTISETNTEQTTNATIPKIQTTTEEPTKLPISESKNVSNETKSISPSCTARPSNVTTPQNCLDTNFNSTTHTTMGTTITITSPPSSSHKDIPIVETTTTTTKTQTFIDPCDIYPKHCDRPKTWETTLKGETRDFFQILKARFGNRFRILEDTTHWPRRVTPHVNDVDDDFQFGHHNEGKEFD